MIPISKPIIKNEEKKALLKVLESGILAQGNEVKKLEQYFSKICGSKYAIAVNNGTSALHTALHSIGIKKGDEIITTPFTFVATANSVLMVGAKPIFVDIDEKTFNIDPKKIEAKITKKTKAILVVNLYGQPCDYDEILKIAEKNNLLVIEDAAQSIGAIYKNKMSGNLADISCFSFYATKNIMSGEGGMITTNDETYSNKAKLFRHHGQDEKTKYFYADLGYNYRMMDLQAAIAYVQLQRLKSITKKRQLNAQKYNKAFNKINGLITPSCDKNSTHVYHQYTLRITKDYPLTREEFINYLNKNNIQTNIYYPAPLFNFPHLSSNNYKISDFPVTNQMTKEVVSIPVHPSLTSSEVSFITNTIINSSKL